MEYGGAVRVLSRDAAEMITIVAPIQRMFQKHYMYFINGAFETYLNRGHDRNQ